MRVPRAFCRGVDRVNDLTGKIVSMLFLPLVLIVMAEVVLRYFFSRPTIWAWDVNIQLAGAIMVLGGGYTLLYKGHVSIDVLAARFPPRSRAIVELATSTLFFAGFGVLLWLSIQEARYSLQVKELYSSVWSPPIYPFRIAIAVAVALLLLQGIVKFIRDLAFVTGSVEGER